MKKIINKEIKRRKKISQTLKGHPYSEESKEKNRQSHLGKKHTIKTRNKLSELTKGKKNPRWKGGRRILKNGYVELTINGLLKEDQELSKQMTNSPRVLEHRLVIAKKLERPLISKEIIHHIDFNKSNNSEDNLELLVSDNRGARRPIICPRCGCQI